MKAPFSSRDIATLVSPMRGAAVAMPAASRARGRDLVERLNIVAENDDGEDELEGGRWMKRFEEPKDHRHHSLYLTLFPSPVILESIPGIVTRAC